jgi:hypothetical protein
VFLCRLVAELSSKERVAFSTGPVVMEGGQAIVREGVVMVCKDTGKQEKAVVKIEVRAAGR